MANHPTTTKQPTAEIFQRRVALAAAISLLVMALLAPFARFGVLETLVVSTDAAATVENIIASEGLFRIAIAAFLIVIMLDVMVAWALYILLRPVNRTLALLTAWLRLAFAAIFFSMSRSSSAAPNSQRCKGSSSSRRLCHPSLRSTTAGPALPWRSSASISLALDTCCSAQQTFPGSSVFS